LDLALDIDDLPAAQPHLRGNSARHAEGEIAKADDREPIHLADLLASGLDPDRPASDFFLQASVEAIAAPDLRVDGRLHLPLTNDLFAGVGGELVGLLQEIDKPAQVS